MSAGAQAAAQAGELAINAYSAYEASKASKRANDTNRDIANAQMAFQERMSNTAHQREREDLIAAGMNPLLSVGKGASTPSGAGTMVTPETSAASGIGKALSKSISTAMDAKRLKNETEMANGKIALDRAAAATQVTQAELNATNAAQSKALTENKALENAMLKAKFPSVEAKARADMKQSEADLIHAGYNKEWAQTDAIMKRTGQATGIIGDAVGAFSGGLGRFTRGLFKGSQGTDRVIDSRTGEILQESPRAPRNPRIRKLD